MYERAYARYGTDDLEPVLGENIFSAGGFQGHTIPNYVTLLENGLDGMLEKVNFWAERNVKDQEMLIFTKQTES